MKVIIECEIYFVISLNNHWCIQYKMMYNIFTKCSMGAKNAKIGFLLKFELDAYASFKSILKH